MARFRKVDRERLIAAKLQGKDEVVLLMASLPGANASVVRQVSELGAVVRFREDTVDYLRVRVPTARVNEILNLNTIQVAAVDGVQMYDTEQELPSAELQKISPPDSKTPAENPFLPTADIGAPQFIRDHPTFDGRGVTIGHLDGNPPDLLSPELKQARSLDGTPITKIPEVIKSLDPIDDESPFRVDMSREIHSDGENFEWQGSTYRAPRKGDYRIGFFDIKAFGEGLLARYLPRTNQTLLPILWDKQTNSIWVDTNLNNNFADESALSDFNSSSRFGVLGIDDPSTPVRETVAYIVLANTKDELLYLAPLPNGHATNTASVAAGHNFFGGQMNGVAPGARIIPLLRKSNTHSLVEGMILTIQHPKVDLVSSQWAALIPPQDGNSVLGVVFQRLIRKYKKPIFSGADNLGPGITTNAEPSAPDGVISVGGYVSNLTWQSNYGVTTANKDTLMNLSARGPRVDGGFKPDLLAPAAAVSAGFGSASSPAQAPFALPPGYNRAQGTSLSCPMAAGAAALLISAAKQSGVPYDADRIAWALKESARYLPDVGAHEQGNGLINVAAAWEALKHAPASIAISSAVEINVATGPYLKAPNRGPGIYEREGWSTGQFGRRNMTFTRTSGDAEPAAYVIRWTGNDGTFSSPSTIRLPLHTPVSLPVTILPKSTGVHSAILNLDAPNGRARSIYQVMNTVIAAEQFSAAENFTVRREGSAEYPGYSAFYFNVPPKTSLFKIVTSLREGNVRLRFMRPSGKEFDQAHDTPARWLPEYQTGGTLDRGIADPEPGVWQVIVENQNLTLPGGSSAKAREAKFRITASVFRSEPQLSSSRFTNHYAPFSGVYEELPASAYSTRLTISKGEAPVVYEIAVPEGATNLTARLNGGSNGDADVDLYLYSCAKHPCELKAFSARTGTEEKVTVAQPEAGQWKVVIDPVSLGSRRVTLNYTDFFAHSAEPVSGRRLVGLLQLMSREKLTVRYDYNAQTKRVEAVKEQVSLAQALIQSRASRGPAKASSRAALR